MADEFQIHENKRTDKIYVSPRFINKNPLTQEEIHTRRISKVFDVDDFHFFEYLKKEKCVVLRTTTREREEVILTVIESDNRTIGVSIQRFTKVSGKPQQQSLFFHPEEFKKMIDFLRSIKFIDFTNPSHFQVRDDELIAKIQKLDSLAKKFADLGDEEMKDLISNETLKGKDFVNLAFRNEGLKIFKEQLENGMNDEKKWQLFFQQHDWIFGYGLDYRFMTIFDREMSVGDGGTEDQEKPKTDFLSEFNDFTVLVELKVPETPLFENSKNRSGCWCLSQELIDAYSQVLEQKAEWAIKGDRGGNKSKDGRKEIQARTRDPKVILVVGNKQKEILEVQNLTERELKQDTFELFRRDSRNVEIITYDELFERAEFIVRKKSSHNLGNSPTLKQ
ncbi:MAG: DUF4263 domain-containing protein [Candidatus Gracilibacteria bacterium]|nr:DUF4263 domain-containing protein [Candidatus Gracilibacteria bacterium]MDD5179576.1 DUF4263 domain-containing protein [Candidatus Gracilibacteria bacterium]